MRKFLIGAVVFLLVAALGLLAYLLADTLLPETIGEAAPVSAPGSSSRPRVASAGPPTEADVFDAIASESGKNRDTVGWLTVPGTQIDGPVLQSFDNAYYLRRNEQKQEDIYGCYFADYTCSLGGRDSLSPNTVIYGHSDLQDNPEGPRFSQLFKFTDPDFAREHPVIRFSTAEAVMDWEIFAVFYTDTQFAYIYTQPEGAEFTGLVEEARDRSIYLYEVPVTAGDRILTLSTCTVKYGQEEKEQRFVVMARLLPEGQLPQEAALQPNPQPKEPQF